MTDLEAAKIAMRDLLGCEDITQPIGVMVADDVKAMTFGVILATDFHKQMMEVPTSMVDLPDIMCLAAWDPETGEAELIGWEFRKSIWNAAVMNVSKRTPCHTIHQRALRQMKDIRFRICGPVA